jgi:hypothetical protein
MAEQIFIKRNPLEGTAESSISTNDRVSEPSLIPQSATFDSSSADEGDKNLFIRQSYSQDDDDDDGILEGVEANSERKNSLPPSSHDIDCSLFASWEEVASHVFYISTFAILGSVLRVYMGRFFGLDCEQQEHDLVVNDFLTPLSSQICVTSDGKLQRGGAVFVDLPANMLGS